MTMELNEQNPFVCRLCKRKMKVKRSKSLSPEPTSSREAKKAKTVAEDEDANGKSLKQHILEFSDDVLLNIMKYLCPQDLMALSRCCQRLNRVTRDRTLWKLVDFRLGPVMSDDINDYMKFFQPVTTRLAIRSELELESSTLTQSFLKTIRTVCNQLKELALEEFNIDGDKVQITDFPRTLEKLSLKGCHICRLQCKKSYFFKIDLHMPNLTSLILSNCQWLTPHSFLVISKIPKLKELRLDSCGRLGECVAYASLATRFGFKTLEILDLRDTAIGDSEVCCFSSTKTLTHLYLECPARLRSTDSPERVFNQHVQQALQHPVYEDRNLIQVLVDDSVFFQLGERCLISDRAICALGSIVCERRILANQIDGVILIEEDKRLFNNPNLKSLVVRNYSQITNQSLVHLASNALSLEYLDITGTSVTKEGVETFKLERPNVTILSSFDET